jgi:hypothetical protein
LAIQAGSRNGTIKTPRASRMRWVAAAVPASTSVLSRIALPEPAIS